MINFIEQYGTLNSGILFALLLVGGCVISYILIKEKIREFNNKHR